jgi:hypothetical protein
VTAALRERCSDAPTTNKEHNSAVVINSESENEENHTYTINTTGSYSINVMCYAS